VGALVPGAATAPPQWKTSLFERACANLVRNVVDATEELIVTNFGLSAELRCIVALNKTGYVFGKFGACFRSVRRSLW
jgi:hypothetical protein